MLHHRKRRPHGPSGWLRGAGEHCVYPLEVRKATLGSIVAKARSGISRGTARPSSPMPARWDLEGIVSKRKDSMYRSGRSPDWLKMKNAAAPASEARGGRGLGQRPWSLNPYLSKSVMAKKN